MNWQDAIGSILTAGATGNPMAFGQNKLEQAFKQFQMQKMTEQLEMQRDMHKLEQMKTDMGIKHLAQTMEQEDTPVENVISPESGYDLSMFKPGATVGQVKNVSPLLQSLSKQNDEWAIGGDGEFAYKKKGKTFQKVDTGYKKEKEQKAPTKLTYQQGNQEITEIYENGKLSRTITAPRSTAGGTSKPPQGYRWTNDNELEPIPGGPADIKFQNEQAKAIQTVNTIDDSLTRLERAATTLKDHPGLKGITGAAGVFPNMPGGQAANAQALLDNLKSQVSLTVLQNMREASKTGGALGNVSDAEGVRLEENLAPLKKAQSLPEMRGGLQGIIDYCRSARKNIKAGFDASYSGQRSQKTSANNQTYTQEDLEFTAKKHGITVDEVKKKLGAK